MFCFNSWTTKVPTQKEKIPPFVVANVIEKNNTMHNVNNVDIVENSPIPIVIYNVEGELDSLATKDDNKQNLDNMWKFDKNMMQTKAGGGEWGHLS